ncbi:MAG: DNA-processing protein DprA [Candidatus Azobacteroides sp.]|nr:DNA-processing protein DprA [Candidatus Azobacteroides sp.]
MDEQKLLYRIALTQINGIGRILGRNLVCMLGDEEAVFKENTNALQKIPGIGTQLIKEIRKPEPLKIAERELKFIRKNNIRTFFFTDANYPRRLKECADMPLLLYYKGNADLNSEKMLAMVGTRRAGVYGKSFCEKFIREVSRKYPETIIVSGMAYGIDIFCHRTALKNNLSTIGVLAHGLDRIYPYEHKESGREIIEQGGLITEYPSGTIPDKYNFVVRNSIIAGLTDATIVAESSAKGGSLITAEIANAYDREVFAVPGRWTDPSFHGCLNLIKKNKAVLLHCLADIEENLRWNNQKSSAPSFQQTQLCFSELSDEENRILTILANQETHINQLAIKTDIPLTRLAFLLLEMEFKHLLKPFPGGMYKKI